MFAYKLAVGGIVALLNAFFVPLVFAQQELPFATATVQYKTYPEIQTFDATIEAVKRATVSAETSGRIMEIRFDVDDYVEKGSVLVRIANAEQRARLTAAQAKVLEMEAKSNVASTEYNRIKDVYAKGLVSSSALDKAEADLKSAQQQLSIAQANVKESQEQLQYSVVRAPYSGVVVERHIELGEMAKIGQPLLTGFSLDELRAVAYIPQANVLAVRNAQHASVSLNETLLLETNEKNITVSPQAEPTSHTFKTRVMLPQPVAKGVYPGMLVKIGFVTGEKRQLLVPSKALVKRSELKAVYVVKADNHVILRNVRVGGDYGDDQVEILAGLDEGEVIALDPVRAAVYYKDQAN